MVRPILEDVRKRGDRALLEYARKFDRLDRKSRADPGARDSTRHASICRPSFAEPSKSPPRISGALPSCSCRAPGCAAISRRAACSANWCVRSIRSPPIFPAGRYPLPSTIMMTVVPAQVAGVPNICVASPRPVAEVFGTARMLGVNDVFQMGGAQAIAAFAFGTRTVPKRGPHCRPGQYLCRGRQEAAGRRSRDRFRCRTHRDSDHRRGRRSAWICRRHAGAGRA